MTAGIPEKLDFMKFEFKNSGACTFIAVIPLTGETEQSSGTYRVIGNVVLITMDGAPITAVKDKDKLVIEEDGITLIFRKQ
jgi:hypothetical protein